jgi:arylsulfatase
MNTSKYRPYSSALRLFFVAIYTVAAPVLAQESPSSPAPPTRIYFILIDTLRADHLGCYGYERPTSPFIDRLATEGVLFERAFSVSSYTREVVASLFTGLYPTSNSWGRGWNAAPDPARYTLAEIFQQNGYRTALFSSNPVLRDLPFDRGFETNYFAPYDSGNSGFDDQTVLRAAASIKEYPDARWFVYLHLLDPHGEYEPAPTFLQKFTQKPLPNPLPLYSYIRYHLPELRREGFGPGEARFEDMINRYDAEVAYADFCVQTFFEELRPLGLLNDALVIVCADHGEEFLEHGYVEHGWQLYRESIHVPLIFWSPNRLQPQRVSEPVSLVDVFPTILTLAGMGDHTEARDGFSLAERTGNRWFFTRPDFPILSQLLIQSRTMLHMIQYQNWAYLAGVRWFTPEQLAREVLPQHPQRAAALMNGEIEPVSEWWPIQHEELYNLSEDSAQKHNILADFPEKAEEIRRIRNGFWARSVPPVLESEKCSARGAVDPHLREQLEALGYSGH